MGKLKAVPIVGGAYADDCVPWADQDCVNWLPVVAEGEGTRSSAILRTPPGLQEFAAVPEVRRSRGDYVAEGRFLSVKDTTLYQVMPSATMRAIGTVPGTGRVQFTHNKVGSNIEVFIGAGAWGGIYSSDADTLTQITDDGFHGAKSVGYIGHLFLAVNQSGSEFQNSDLDDGSSWNALETYQGESKPDKIVTLKVANGEVVLLNSESMDHFAYTGETNALFQNKLIPIDVGCGAAEAVSLLDNAMCLIDQHGSGREKRGYELRRITTHAIEQAWARCDIAKAYSFTWEDRGHKVVYFTFPDGHTWGFDFSCRQWHRRQSEGMKRWRLATLVKWNGDWYGSEFNSGRVFKLVWGYVLEGSERMRRSRTSGVLHDNQNRINLAGVEIVLEASGEATTATSVIPFAFSTDPSIVNNLPDGAVGDVVSFQYITVGGVSPITFAVTSGALPAGITLNAATGALTGTYTTAEHDNAWTITATDAAGSTATRVETQYVLDMLGTPPNAEASTAYTYTLTGTEGTAPYTFVLASGSLPPGLSLASGGTISGTTGATLASYPFTVTMTDAAGVDQTKTYGIQVLSTAVPAGIVPDLWRWWTFDNTLDSIPSGHPFSNPILPESPTYPTGTKNEEVAPDVQYLAGTDLTTNTDLSYWFWAHIATGHGASTSRMGLADSNGVGSDVYLWVDIANAGTTLQLIGVDMVGPAYVFSSTASCSNGQRVFCVVNLDQTAKTATLYVNDDVGRSISFATVPGFAHFDVFTIHRLSGSAPEDHMDELGLMKRKLTTAERTYLYNGGLGKSYSEVIADSAL